MQISIIVFAGM